ncbi:MAG: carboxypeptidase-like regulatory domain-containing protein [Candidatus Roizmanbacteria bacterium]|nr:carboxypeptidase-like regulatory domain-containing protein [Candidatus Roizmanbacteria bacterium]
MKWLLTGIGIFLFIVVPPLYAQINEVNTNLDTNVPEAVRNYCLSYQQLGDDSEHTVRLTGTGLKPNTPFELWRNIDNNWVCATDMDGAPLCQSVQGEEIPTIGKEFQLKTETTLVTDGNGNVNIPQVHSYSEDKKNHFFFAFQEYSVRSTAIGDNPGNKLAQIEVTEGNSNECTAIYWDPEGTVFDALTLEPLSGALVSLLREDRSAYPESPQVRKNPFNTSEDGHFAFYVEDGTYFLGIKKSQYRFPLSSVEITNLSTRLAETNLYTNLYTGDPIVQLGAIEHRDVPVMPSSSAQATSIRPKILSSIIVRQPSGNQTIFGTVTHPKLNLEVYVGVSRVASAIANNYGVFTIEVSKTKIDPLRPLELVAIKPKGVYGLKTGALTQQPPDRSVPVLLYPVPEFIEGYITVDKEILKNAEVRLAIPSLNNKNVLTIQADENGFIKIPSSLVPQTEFALLIADEDGTPVSSMTTASFAENNSEYMKEAGVNLFDESTATIDSINSPIRTLDEQGRMIFPTPAGANGSPTPSSDETAQQKEQQGLVARAIQLVVTLLLLCGIGGIIWYIKRRTTPTPPVQP